MARDFQGHVFIGISFDGFIARNDGDIRWLTERELEFSTTGYDEFIDGVDGLIIGRATYQTVEQMDDWSYGEKRVLVVSTTLDPETVSSEHVSVHASVEEAVAQFISEGRTHAYVDGGKLIQSFLRAGLINSFIITRAPVLIGEGAPLFGSLSEDVELEHLETKVLGGGFVQSRYAVAQ